MVAQEEGTAINGLNISQTPHSHSYYKWWQSGDASNSGGSWVVFPDKKGNDTTGGAIANITLSSNDTETRPKNYTVRIWKRIS